ncbi:uncharacterized protein LOC126896212 isoform X2 [Daktulosphaira vitifoliae]|uniref:uncharacterized protein LOC126896212 isoform X2 n=1 Tax=Daktulosphaira vitifoliae TaxID=58002 RepID=UPI0021AA4F04|nr:uncharacterized protein LOC126896212 isoform X2 [Daktulosphaira vitifoliae]
MNIFSQTKLLKSLKLKKNNNSSSIDTISQNTTVTNVKKPNEAQSSSNNSMLSETDSFVEIMHSTQTQGEKLSQTIFKNSNKNLEMHHIVPESLKKQCPLCSQFIDEKNFISHVKLCGTTNNISSDLVIKAVDLQERQDAERKALGLPSLIVKKPDNKKKPGSKRQTKIKVENDANLNLAIAMSLSLQESTIAQIQEESENLFEAGLENEALEKQKTLEVFGFMTNHSVKGKSKSNMHNTKLFQESKEDQERRITEKVAIILLDSENDPTPSIILNEHNFKTVQSMYLKSIRNEKNLLWEKASLQNEVVSEFYVPVLSKFIPPHENDAGSSLKEVSQIPGKWKSPNHETNLHINVVNHEQILTNKCVRKEKVATNKSQAFLLTESNLSNQLSYKWKSMVDNQFMSDVIIYTKDEKEISAHILVLHVQCPSILNDIILDPTLSNNGKTKKIIMWLEYEYEACFAFLELIYSGKETLKNSKYSKDYLNLRKRYDVLMEINNDEEVDEIMYSQKNSYKRKSTDFNNMCICKRFKATSPEMFTSDDIVKSSSSSPNFLNWWLNNCDKSQQPDNLFSTKKNFSKENSQKNLHLEQSPCHSFHSASTADIYLDTEQLNKIEKQDSNSIELFSSNKSEDEEPEELQNIKISPDVITIDSDTENSIGSLSTNVLPKVHKSCEELNLTIPCYSSSYHQLNTSKANKLNIHEHTTHQPKLNNDSLVVLIDDDGSLDSVHSCNTNILSQNIVKNQIPPKKLFNTENKLILSNPLITKKTVNVLNEFELNDVSSNDSIYSDTTNILTKTNTSKHNSYPSPFKIKSSNHVLSSSDKNVICDLNDSNSICSMATNIIPKKISPCKFTSKNVHNSTILNVLLQNTNTYQKQLNALTEKESKISTSNVIELNDDSSTDSIATNILLKNSNQLKIPLISLDQEYKNSLIMTKSQNDNLSVIDINNASSVFSSATNILSKTSVIELNNSKKDVTLISPNKTNLLQNSFSNSEMIKINNLNFEDTFNLSLISNNVPTDKIDSAARSNYEEKFKSSDIIKISTQSPQLSSTNMKNEFNEQNILSNQIVNLKKNEEIFDITNKETSDIHNAKENEQIIDDPWMDYNDWQSLNFSPQKSIKDNSINNSYDALVESAEKTPIKFHIHNDQSYSCNIKNKSALTPNKFGSKTSTPRSIRRIRSESTINNSKVQVTPMLDYSSMKTPDFMKELDRYGLKPNLGKRKGKQLLKYIYNELHPNATSKEYNQIIDKDLCEDLDSTMSSETGIPEYLEDSSDELETFSQAHSNKVPIELGFSQLLKADKSLHNKILCYEPIWIEVLKEDLKKYNVNVGMQKLMTFLDDKCITFRSKLLNDQRQKKVANKNQKRRKLF